MSANRGAQGTRSAASGLLILLVLSPAHARAADDPRAWLERMSSAVEDLNYEGTVVHLLGEAGQHDLGVGRPPLAGWRRSWARRSRTLTQAG